MADLSKKRIFYLSLVTLVGMGGAGIAIIAFAQKKEVAAVLFGGRNYTEQLISGIDFGALSAALAALLLRNPRFGAVKAFFAQLIQQISPGILNILFYSFCAGVGEEILFRAGIQPYLGIWPTSFVFVLLHGYIKPSNLNLSIYGVFLIFICAGFGYLFKIFGLLAASTAHFVYDVCMFSLLRYAYKADAGN